jgi:hypothetical protein
MTRTASPTSPRQVTRPNRTKARVTSRTRPAGVRPKTAPSARAERGAGGSEPGLLGRYTGREDRLRQVVALPGAWGSVLVVDRDASTLGDRRLVAHLAADEPRCNAALVCEHYLRDPAGRWCRNVIQEDLEVEPFPEEAETGPAGEAVPCAAELTDTHGRAYSLELHAAGMSIPELRWCRCPAAEQCSPEPISMREAIASLESYEPVRTLTRRALALHRDDPTVSVAVLRAERARMDVSKIVLNRGLRQAVLAAAAAQAPRLHTALYPRERPPATRGCQATAMGGHSSRASFQHSRLIAGACCISGIGRCSARTLSVARPASGCRPRSNPDCVL